MITVLPMVVVIVIPVALLTLRLINTTKALHKLSYSISQKGMFSLRFGTLRPVVSTVYCLCLRIFFFDKSNIKSPLAQEPYYVVHGNYVRRFYNLTF